MHINKLTIQGEQYRENLGADMKGKALNSLLKESLHIFNEQMDIPGLG